MHTTLYLIRNAATDWTRDGRVTGRRELGLSDEGRAQADTVADALATVDVTEVLSSPLPRAVETADRVAARHKLDVARDPRLTDFAAGKFEGRRWSELAGDDEWRRFAASLEQLPGGEKIADVRDRMVSSVRQALADNELGASIAVVSHAGPLRVLISHFLGMPITQLTRLRLSPASVTVLRFDSDAGVPRLLALNWLAELKTAAG